MTTKHCELSKILLLALGVGGAAQPAAGLAAQEKPEGQVEAVEQEGEKTATGEIQASTQTKVVVSRKQIESGNEQEGYGETVKASVAGVVSNNGAGSANDSLKFRGIQLGLYTNYRLNGGLAITNVITIPNEDKEKIEALKGANALMFGLASPAGIVNLITKRPADRDVSSLTVAGNAFGQYGGSVDISRKFGEDGQFGLRFNGAGLHIATGVDGVTGTGAFGSIAADWKPTRDLIFRLDYENYSRDVAEQGSIAPLAPVKGVIAVPKVPDLSRMLGVTWGHYKPHTVNQALRVDYALAEGWGVMAEIGSSDSHRSRVQARTTGKYNIETGDATMQLQWIKGQRYVNHFSRSELYGNFDLLGTRHSTTFGVSMSERESNNPFGFAKVNTPINLYDPDPIPFFAEPKQTLRYAPSKNTEKSIYAYDTVQIGPSLQVLAGLRKSDAEFMSTNQKTFAQTVERNSPLAPGGGVMWAVAPGTTLYGSYMRAFEDGPTAPTGTVNEFQILAPTESTQKEIGLRSTFFKGLYVNVDYFDIMRANAVTSQTPGAHFNEYLYDGKVHLFGYEIAANAEINRYWSIRGTSQIMKGEQQTEVSPELNGKSPENLAKVMGSLNVDYRVPSVMGLTVRAGANYIGPRYINALNQGQIPSTTLFSAGMSYQTKVGGHKTSWQLNVTNLTDKRYWASVTSSAYGLGQQRAIRFSMKMEY